LKAVLSSYDFKFPMEIYSLGVRCKDMYIFL
jgi:hypothetical protein